jgi:hypothetical protein
VVGVHLLGTVLRVGEKNTRPNAALVTRSQPTVGKFHWPRTVHWSILLFPVCGLFLSTE